MILVTGATGNIGHALVDILVKRGAEVRVIVLGEDATANRFRPPGITQASSFPKGVEIFEGDLTHPETVADAFDGVTELFINPRAVGNVIDDVLAVAKAHGVERVVTLSASNVDDDVNRQPSRFNGDRNKEVEAAVMNSGLEATALRSTFYAINTVGFWAGQIKAGDIIRGPGAEWENSPLDENDVAEVAAEALLTDRFIGRRLVLSGPESLSQAKMVEIIGGVIGRPLRYEELPSEVAQKGMLERGFSKEFADAFLHLVAEDAGKPSTVSDDIVEVLGRPPHSFAEWVAKHKADFEG